MADLYPILLFVNGVDVGASMEWSMSTEEVLGGVGAATILVQDRTNIWEPSAHWDVKVVIRSSGWVLWRGEIITPSVELPVGKPFRVWKLQCSDYNNEFPKRKVGAFDGKTWIDQYNLGVFVNIDPFADSLETDKLTVQTLLDHYIRVNGEAFNTTDFVGEYLNPLPSMGWDYSNLQSALEELASLVVDNLQFWADPDLKFHWVTIPAWQDLAGEEVTVFLDETESTSALLFGEGGVDQLALGPADASDLEGVPGDVGFSDLKFSLDGSEMPEQVYIRGGTGYVYNAPGLNPGDETKTVVKSPTLGPGATYQLTFLSTTKIWHRDSTGYISIYFDYASAGGPYDVKWIKVPWNEERHKGGHFWKLLSGPYVGRLVDNDTNVLSGYGSIRVEGWPAGATEPKVGVGGSGWAGEVTQDPNKRQAYLEAPVSTDRAKRDALGSAALYRGATPTLRGSLKVRGIDGWRAGQVFKITDARLPSYLNGKYFLIQRVRTTLLPETELREYTLDWGDGPTSRYSAQWRGDGDAAWPPPAIQIDVRAHDLTPGPSSTQTIVGQLVNGLGEPWAIEGKVVEWSFECYNSLGVLQTGQGSLSVTVSTTDKHGKARTKLTTGTGTNLVYYVFARVVAD